jgi:glycosyltransferase involved in cell wall biosynthesis
LGGWRYYAGSAYELEQLTFSVTLWRRIRHNFDILHVQDPLVADILNKLHRRGLSRPRVILANGTGEKEDFLKRFPIIQQLTPYSVAGIPYVAAPGQLMFVIPNFIDLLVFEPGDQTAARRHFGLAEEGNIILCCAAIRKHHKRIDYLIQEFARFLSAQSDRRTTLVLAGAREQDTDDLINMGRTLLGDRFRVFVDLPRQEMPLLYRAADLFVLTSLYEMFGTVLIEAMASGLPVLCHDAPAFRFVVGPAGHYCTLAADGALCQGFTATAEPAARAAIAAAARRHVEANFGKSVVVETILRMYETVSKPQLHRAQPFSHTGQDQAPVR